MRVFDLVFGFSRSTLPSGVNGWETHPLLSQECETSYFFTKRATAAPPTSK